jgi:hypothetical protein
VVLAIVNAQLDDLDRRRMREAAVMTFRKINRTYAGRL